MSHRAIGGVQCCQVIYSGENPAAQADISYIGVIRKKMLEPILVVNFFSSFYLFGDPVNLPDTLARQHVRRSNVGT